MSRTGLFALVGGLALAAACSERETSPLGPEEEAVAHAATAKIGYIELPMRGAAINRHATIAGSVMVGGESQAAIAQPGGQITILPGLGGSFSTAEDINDHGDVAGSAETAAGELHAVVWWRDGTVQDLGTLGGSLSMASAINNRGEIAGTSENELGHMQAFFWADDRMAGLPNLTDRVGDFSASFAYDLNDRGYVVGWGIRTTQRAALWHDGEVFDLGTLAFESSASAINERGEVVGGSIPDFQTWARGVWWDRSGQLAEVGILADPCPPDDFGCVIFSSTSGINDRGQIVGSSQTNDFQGGAYIWEDGVMTQLVAPDGTLLGSAIDINNRGTILGVEFAGGVPYTWLLGPQVPSAEPRRKVAGSVKQQGSGLAVTARPAPRAWGQTYCRSLGRLPGPSAALDVAAGCVRD